MELVISLRIGDAQVSAKCDTFEEAGAFKQWLMDQGMIPPQKEPAGQARHAQGVDGAKVYPINPDVDLGTVEAAETATADQSEVIAAALREKAEQEALAAHVAMEAAAQAEAAKVEKAAKAAAKKAAKEAKPANTIEDVTKAVTDYAAKFGPTEARALFARFGVNRGGDLKPEQFDEFVSVSRDYLARGIKATEGEPVDLM